MRNNGTPDLNEILRPHPFARDSRAAAPALLRDRRSSLSPRIVALVVASPALVGAALFVGRLFVALAQ